MTDKQIERVNTKIVQLKKALSDDKKFWGGYYHDGRGIRYMIPQQYIKINDYKGGLRYIHWFDKNFSQDAGYCTFWFECTFILYQCNKIGEAIRKAYNTFFSHTELLCAIFAEHYNNPTFDINFARAKRMNYLLKNPPELDRRRELWLQHAAGFIIFQDMRNYAIERIPADTSAKIKEQIIKGIDDTIYGLMMIMDGVTGTLENDEYSIRIESKILLEKNKEIVQEINTLNGDGMCMGFHGWKEGDFGEDAIYTIEE